MIPINGDPMLNLVYRTVHKYIKNHRRIPSELKRSLQKSDHTNTLIKNLTYQHRNVQDLQIKRRGRRLKDKTIINSIEDFTEVFLVGVEGHANKRRESELDKYKRDHAGDEQKEMQSALEGNSTGVFEDMGLVIPIDQREKPTK